MKDIRTVSLMQSPTHQAGIPQTDRHVVGGGIAYNGELQASTKARLNE